MKMLKNGTMLAIALGVLVSFGNTRAMQSPADQATREPQVALEQLVFSEGGEQDRIKQVIASLAAGSDSTPLIDKIDPYRQARNYSSAYRTQNRVFTILENMQLTQDDINSLQGIKDMVRASPQLKTNIQKLTALPAIQHLVDKKIESIKMRARLSVADVNMPQLRKAIELQIIRTLRKQNIL